MSKPLDRLSAAVMDAFAGVLAQHGLCITSYSNTQHFLDGEALLKVLREAAREAGRAVFLAICELVRVRAMETQS